MSCCSVETKIFAYQNLFSSAIKEISDLSCSVNIASYAHTDRFRTYLILRELQSMVMLGVLLPALFVAFVAVSASHEEEAYVSNFAQM